jgi:hypothetical protein
MLIARRARMTRSVLPVAFIGIVLMVNQTSGQSIHPPIMESPADLGHIDRPAVPMEQAADVVVELIPDETMDLLGPTPYERVVRGSIARLEKGRVPPMIVHTRDTFVTGLQAGVPARVFLVKFKDRDAYYIIGVRSMGSGGKP